MAKITSTVTPNGAGSVSVTETHDEYRTYEYWTDVFTAVPNSGYRFKWWNLTAQDGTVTEGIGSNPVTCSCMMYKSTGEITPSSTVSVEAVFEPECTHLILRQSGGLILHGSSGCILRDD